VAKPVTPKALLGKIRALLSQTVDNVKGAANLAVASEAAEARS